MRKLSPTFLQCLKTGFLSPITNQVKTDHDLNLEIRDGYINIYYKGNSLLRLVDTGSLICYKAEIHPKFLEDINVPLKLTEETVPKFIKFIPFIKENIIRHGQGSLETEYEQMIIRANNYEPRNNTEYFIIDRQYAVKENRFDLTGIYWDRNGRQRNREASVCLMEVKFALNPDIQLVHEQLTRYYEALKDSAAAFAEELEGVFKQKLALGLYCQSQDRLSAMKSLVFSRDIKDFQFILVLVDYNPNSSLLAMEKIRQLPFASQVKLFHTGFGIWHVNVLSL